MCREFRVAEDEQGRVSVSVIEGRRVIRSARFNSEAAVNLLAVLERAVPFGKRIRRRRGSDSSVPGGLLEWEESPLAS